MTSPRARVCLRILLLALAPLALAACETTGLGTTTEAAKPVEPPITRRLAAEQCWMAAEKAHATMPLDKRADIVNKCIEQKLAGASGNTEPAGPPPEAKKKKPAAAAADAEKKKPATPSAGDKDQKPADTEAPAKKP